MLRTIEKTVMLVPLRNRTDERMVCGVSTSEIVVVTAGLCGRWFVGIKPSRVYYLPIVLEETHGFLVYAVL